MYSQEIELALSIIEKAKKEKIPIIFYDTETEGLNPKSHHIIQISAKKVNPETLDVITELNEYINPDRPLENIITQITGITDLLLSTKPLEPNIFPKIYDFFGDKAIVVGHNVSFDNKMLYSLYERNGKTIQFVSLDTCKMARQIIQKGKEIKDYKLGTVAAFYGADAGIDFHNSNDDILATYRIFKIMLNEYQESTFIVPKNKTKIVNVSYFLGFRGHNRVYVHTTSGALYYDGLDKKWDSKEITMNTIDMDDLQNQLFSHYSVSSDEDFFIKVRDLYYKKMESYVGKNREFVNIEKAEAYVKKANSKHFDTETIAKDGLYQVTLVKFYKSKAGKAITTA